MSECVEAPGCRTANGYGLVSVGSGKQEYAHRHAWESVNGPIPSGLVVMHSCDNRGCINVDHLSVGTQGDNLRDMVAKGRHWLSGRTHCQYGHEFTQRNGKNVCRPCINRRKREHMKRKKEAV